MELDGNIQLLRIYLGEDDRYEKRPLYEVIVEEARHSGMAGATVLHGIMGFGKPSRIHSAKILRISEDLPLVVEIVDKADRIASFLPILDKMMKKGLVTLEDIKVISYRHGGETSE